MYPIAYRANVGIIDNSTGEPISANLPIISQSNGGRSGIGIGSVATRNIIRPLVRKPALSYRRNIYSDLEFKEYFDWNNLKQLLVSLFHSFISNYTRLLFSQPFEISRVLLQIGSFKLSSSHRQIGSSDILSDSDSDDASVYFEQVDDTNNSSSTLRESRIEKSPVDPSVVHEKRKMLRKAVAKDSKTRSVRIQPESLNIFDIISSLISREGPRGAFKGINTSFLMNTVQYTIQSWISGFVSGLLGIPDPLFVDISHSPNANVSLGLSVFSHVITNMMLSGIALIRMKFIVSTSTRGTRSFRQVVKGLPRFSLFKIPRELIIPSFITNLVRAATQYCPDYLLSSIFQITKYNNSYAYNFLSLVLQVGGLFLKLPFETLYSRAQVDCLLHSNHIAESLKVEDDDLCVDFGGYYGYLSTLYYVVAGTKPVNYGSDNSLNAQISLEADNSAELNKGFPAIFRAWKVGLVHIVSNFTLNLLVDEADDNRLTEEEL